MPHTPAPAEPLTLAELTAGRPVRLAVLSNPGSGRNRETAGARISELLAAHPHVAHERGACPAEIAAALHRLARSDPRVLVINGGDGTVAAALGALFNESPFPRPPLLALLAGGTTNMTAADAGMKGGAVRALARLLRWSQAVDPGVDTVRRPVLRVRPGTGQPELYGMFFGAGAIIKGIEYCQQRILRRGLRDGIGPGLCLLRILYAWLRGDHQDMAPVPLQAETRPPLESPPVERDYFILLASTLERLFLGMRPYWGEGDSGLHFSAIGARPRRFLRSLPGLLRGRPGSHVNPENGYWSGRVESLSLALDGTFTIDGELYPAHRERGPLQISRTPALTFLRF